LRRGASLRVVPGDRAVRARELQVHGLAVDEAGPGRTAVNVAGAGTTDLHRGDVLTDDPAVVATGRLLVQLVRPLPDRARVRVHLGTGSVDGAIGRSGRDAIALDEGAAGAILRLAAPIAAAPGDRFVLRRASGPDRAVGGVVLDVAPARGISRRRQSAARVRRMVEALGTGAPAPADVPPGADALAAARLDLHGALVAAGRVAELADDVRDAATDDLLAGLAGGDPGAGGDSPGRLSAARVRVARSLRRLVTLRRDDAERAATDLLDRLVADGRLLREGDRLRLPGTEPTVDAVDPALRAAMDRLEGALAVAAPPPLTEAARAAACPTAGIRELERTGRIVVLDADLAYAASTYRVIEAQALDLAGRAPLTPAALRDATGTSRRYVLAILADLGRRGLLRRTEAGHLPGPRAGLVRGTSVAVTPGRR
jgi:selenocysteine-specific elongation factor